MALATELSRRGVVTTAVALSPSDGPSPLGLEALGPTPLGQWHVAGAARAGAGGTPRRGLRIEDAAGLCPGPRRLPDAVRLSEHRRSVSLGRRPAAPDANRNAAAPCRPRGRPVISRRVPDRAVVRGRSGRDIGGAERPGRRRVRPPDRSRAHECPCHARCRAAPAGGVPDRRADRREATSPGRRGRRVAPRRRARRRRRRAAAGPTSSARHGAPAAPATCSAWCLTCGACSTRPTSSCRRAPPKACPDRSSRPRSAGCRSSRPTSGSSPMLSGRAGCWSIPTPVRPTSPTAVRTALDDATRLGPLARRHAVAHHSWNAVAPIWSDVIAGIVSGLPVR